MEFLDVTSTMKYSIYLITSVLVIFLLSGCGNDDETINSESAINNDSLIVAWLDSMDIDAIRNESGIYYYPEVENPSGETVNNGQVLSIFYHLLDLEEDTITSYQPSDGDSLQFQFASNAVFPVGIDNGIGVMRQGEIYNFILPPELAYQQIPSFTTSDSGIVRFNISLVDVAEESEILDVELDLIDEYILVNDINDTVSVTIESIDTTFIGMDIASIDTTFSYDIDSAEYFTSGLRYKLTQLGDTTRTSASSGDTITLNYVTSLVVDTTQIIDQNSSFIYILDSNIPAPLVESLDFIVRRMLPGESGLIMTPSSLAYRESALVIPASIVNEAISEFIVPEYVSQVAPYQPLLIEVTRTN